MRPGLVTITLLHSVREVTQIQDYARCLKLLKQRSRGTEFETVLTQENSWPPSQRLVC